MKVVKELIGVGLLLSAFILTVGDISAHNAEFSHAHFGSTIQPDYEPFAGIWYRDIRYATAPGIDANSQSLDVYTLDLPLTNAPVMMYVHGGGGDRGDKAVSFDIGDKPAYFIAKEGFIFVSVNYRLGKDGAALNAQQDVADAVAWVHSNIARLGGNPDQIFLSGHSFGAGLAGQVGTDETFLKKAGKDLHALKAVVLLDGGAVDAKKITAGGYLPSILFLSTGPNSNAPGGNTMKGAQAMVDALRSTGHSGELVELFGKDHFTASSDIGKYNDPTTLAVHRFINTVLERKESKTPKGCCPPSPSLPPRSQGR